MYYKTMQPRRLFCAFVKPTKLSLCCDCHIFFLPSEESAALGNEKPKFHPDCRIHGYHRADVRDYCDTEYELGLMADPANYPFDPEACAETQVMTNVVPIVSSLGSLLIFSGKDLEAVMQPIVQ